MNNQFTSEDNRATPRDTVESREAARPFNPRRKKGRRMSEKPKQQSTHESDLHKMSPINGQGYDAIETAKFKPGLKKEDISSSELSIDIGLYAQIDQNNGGNEQSFAESDIMLIPERKKLQIRGRGEKIMQTPKAKPSQGKLKLPPINLKEIN